MPTNTFEREYKYYEKMSNEDTKKDFVEFTNNKNLLNGGLPIDLNTYTTCIPIDKAENLKKSKKSLMHLSVLEVLSYNNIINFDNKLASLYPIKTLGDGNCLCHAVLIYLIGLHDTEQKLRTSLCNYMNNKYENELKERFFLHRKAYDKSYSVESDEHLLNEEWKEVKFMGKIVSSNKPNIKDEKTNRMVYLEDIHIFALANHLKRPIIVISLGTIKDLQTINLRGIYLPVLNNKNECIKEPILIAFHNFHFCPLLYTIDPNDGYDDDLNTNFDDNFVKDDGYDQDLLRESNTKKNKTFTYIPLVYENFESMKIHFLKSNEEKDAYRLLNEFLRVVELPLNTSNSDAYEDRIPIICCKIGTNRTFKYNGLSMYFDYLNNKNEYDYENKCLNNENEQINRNNSNDKLKTSIKLCKKAGCTNIAYKHYNYLCEYCYNSTKSKENFVTNTCKTLNCQNLPISISNGYCKNCFLLKSSKYSKCKSLKCSRICDRVKYDGLCEICFNNTIIANKRCKTMNCSGYCSDESNANGYCKTCFDLIYRSNDILSNTYEKCRGENCSNIAIRAGYCERCYDKRLNYCKSRTCTNEGKYDGYCAKCWTLIQTQKPMSSNRTIGICEGQNCRTIVYNNDVYCKKCIDKQQYQQKQAIEKPRAIPVRVEKHLNINNDQISTQTTLKTQQPYNFANVYTPQMQTRKSYTAFNSNDFRSSRFSLNKKCLRCDRILSAHNTEGQFCNLCSLGYQSKVGYYRPSSTMFSTSYI